MQPVVWSEELTGATGTKPHINWNAPNPCDKRHPKRLLDLLDQPGFDQSGPMDGGRHDSGPGHCDAAQHDSDIGSRDFAIGRVCFHISAAFIPIANHHTGTY